MLTRKFQDREISFLGFGAMRLPCEDGRINRKDVCAMVDDAMAQGINYFDTAWGYHGGESEGALGKALAPYPRASYFLADKFPGYDLSNMDKVAQIFEQQLARVGVDYFDFYLFHNVCEMNIDAYLDPKYGIYDYLIAQKKAGRIKHLGFSTHGTLETVKRFLAAYGEDMEFCQIQLNWLDYEFQDAKAKVALLNERGLPIIVMEPLRGGMLAREDLGLDAPVQTAFSYLASIPGVFCVLSGMSTPDQMRQNIEICKSLSPLTKEKEAALYALGREMTAKTALPCTSCRYCTDHCPMSLNIPYLIDLYNEYTYTKGDFRAPMAISALDWDKKPSACIACRACEAVCPQTIKISEMMSDFSARLGLKQ